MNESNVTMELEANPKVDPRPKAEEESPPMDVMDAMDVMAGWWIEGGGPANPPPPMEPPCGWCICPLPYT